MQRLNTMRSKAMMKNIRTSFTNVTKDVCDILPGTRKTNTCLHYSKNLLHFSFAFKFSLVFSLQE